MSRTHTQFALSSRPMVTLGCLVAAMCVATSASAQQAPNANQQTVTATPIPTIQWSQQDEIFVDQRIPTYLTRDPSFDALSSDEAYTGAQIAIGYGLGAYTVPGLRAYVAYGGGGLNPSRFDGHR